MKEKILYKYTKQEKRFIEQRFQEYLNAIRIVAEFHDIALDSAMIIDNGDHTALVEITRNAEIPAVKKAPEPPAEVVGQHFLD